MGYVGWRLGLSSELVKLTGLVGGFFLGFRYYQGLGDWVAARTFLSVEWSAALVLSLLLVGVYLGLTRGLRLLGKLATFHFEPRLNQMGGFLTGLLRAGLITSVILVALRQLPSPYLTASVEEHSLVGPTLFRVAPAVYDTARPMGARFLSALKGQGG